MIMPAAMIQEDDGRKRPILRYLRIAFSVTCGIACVLLVMLWVRSYWCRDCLQGNWVSSRALIGWSDRGQLVFLLSDHAPGWPWRLTYVPADEEPYRTQWKWGDSTPSSLVAFPHWFPSMLFAAFATVPWIGHFKWQFSLRTLLIAMTLIALGLGIVAISN
jgi:hypothetical protein